MPWTRPWSGDCLKQSTCFFLLETSILLTFLVLLQPAHCAQASSLQGEASNAVNGSEYRLPGEVLPLSYNLSLLIDMENLVTEGEVQIKLTVTRPTSNITLHANQTFLSIKHDQVRVEFEDSPKIGVLGHLGDEEEMRRKDFYVVLLNQTLETGQTVMLTIPFTGKVSDSVDPSDPITCSSTNFHFHFHFHFHQLSLSSINFHRQGVRQCGSFRSDHLLLHQQLLWRRHQRCEGAPTGLVHRGVRYIDKPIYIDNCPKY